MSPLQKKFVTALTVVGLLAGIAWRGYEWRLSRLSEQCVKASLDQNWNTLEQAAREWQIWQPDSDEAILYLANAMQQQGRYLDAAAVLAEMSATSSKSVATRLARIQLLFGPGSRPLEAETACLELIRDVPATSAAHNYLIGYYALTLQRGKLREAVRNAIRLGVEQRESYFYLLLSDSLRLGDGEHLNAIWLTRNPDTEVFEVARVIQMEHHLPAAGIGLPDLESPLPEQERLARQLLERYPSNLNLLAFEIDRQIQQGNQPRVIELLAQAPQAAEQDNRFWRFKAWLHYVHDEFELAQQSCRRALELHPLDMVTIQQFIESLRGGRQIEEATRYQEIMVVANRIRDEIQTIPDVKVASDDLLRQLGRLAAAVGDQQVAQAIDQRVGGVFSFTAEPDHAAPVSSSRS